MKTSEKSTDIQAVKFALEILEHIARSKNSIGVSELARAFGTPKSKIYRHLKTLQSSGYLIQDKATERYSISARLVALGQSVSESFELSVAAHDIARDLRDKLGHAVTASRIEEDGMRILLLVPSRSSIEISVKVGSLLSFHASSQGKIALAFGNPALAERVLSHEMEQLTPNTVTDPIALRDEIEQIREQQWAISPSQTLIGLNALAAPVFDSLGGLAGAIALSDSVQYIGDKPTKEQVDNLLIAAQKISTDLGMKP